ncbi:hypothetical protein NSK_005657 [Nannochloropsis salina CCMP1776]|uniref:UBC core domain-containing protein n=1 Tax=Nannochloropsis salina CCMP1776 TaxID=1027361 RepID=A0A4D9CUV5_9STRA|nr:hypothetical protein NSK_005657 [Nannochloropsis salina CCMP1776]|eukprot:TFJ83032.1 hypothetical protein NSK_005657 [Nannochloropsis salina CCMP1776]
MYDLVNVFETFLPQLLRYPNPSDPLNADAANLLLRDPEGYHARVHDYVRRYASVALFLDEEEKAGRNERGREAGRPTQSSPAPSAGVPRQHPHRGRQPSLSSSVATTVSAAFSSSLTPSTEASLLSSSSLASPASSPFLRPRNYPRSTSLGSAPVSTLLSHPTPMVVSDGCEAAAMPASSFAKEGEVKMQEEGEGEDQEENRKGTGEESDVDSDVSELSDIDI